VVVEGRTVNTQNLPDGSDGEWKAQAGREAERPKTSCRRRDTRRRESVETR